MGTRPEKKAKKAPGWRSHQSLKDASWYVKPQGQAPWEASPALGCSGSGRLELTYNFQLPVPALRAEVPRPGVPAGPAWCTVSAQHPPPGLLPNPVWSSLSWNPSGPTAAALGGTALGTHSGRSPWKVGRSRGSPCQHLCMRRRRLLQARGRALQTGGSSGRWPFTTFTMMCRMFFSSARKRHTSQGSEVVAEAGSLISGRTHSCGEAQRDTSGASPCTSSHRGLETTRLLLKAELSFPYVHRASPSSACQVLQATQQLPDGSLVLYHRANLLGRQLKAKPSSKEKSI